jgi:hypothetical protein
VTKYPKKAIHGKDLFWLMISNIQSMPAGSIVSVPVGRKYIIVKENARAKILTSRWTERRERGEGRAKGGERRRKGREKEREKRLRSQGHDIPLKGIILVTFFLQSGLIS